jgi:hypothetical protein
LAQTLSVAAAISADFSTGYTTRLMNFIEIPPFIFDIVKGGKAPRGSALYHTQIIIATFYNALSIGVNLNPMKCTPRNFNRK